jgi:hypothetical protein
VERATNEAASAGYFFAWQRFDDACQSPPAFSQSAWLWIVENEPVGLAEGDEPEDDVEPSLVDDGEPLVDGADDPLLEPVAPVLPVLEPPEVEPAAPLLLPLPAAPPVWAATSAGAKQIIPIRTKVSIFFIPVPPWVRSEWFRSAAAGGSNNRALDRSAWKGVCKD